MNHTGDQEIRSVSGRFDISENLSYIGRPLNSLMIVIIFLTLFFVLFS